MTAPGGARPLDHGAVRRVQLLPGLTVVVLTVLVLWLASRVAELLIFLFLAVLIAVYLDAFMAFLRKRTRLGHGAAFALALFLTFVAIAVIAALIVPPLVDQTRQLIIKLPDYAVAWRDWFGRLLDRFPALRPLWTPEKQSDFVTSALAQVQGIASGILPRVFDAAHFFIIVASTAAMALYMAMHPEIYRRFLISLAPPRHREATADVLSAVTKTLRSWVLAQLLTMLVLGALMAVGLRILNVPYWLTFGIFSGVAAIVPFFGTLISTVVPAIFVLGGPGGGVAALLVLLLGVVVHLIEGNVVEPLIMARGVNIPPVFSIMAVLVGGTLLGLAGLLIAVPALCVVMVLVRKVLLERVYGDAATPGEAHEDAALAHAPANPAPPEPESA